MPNSQMDIIESSFLIILFLFFFFFLFLEINKKIDQVIYTSAPSSMPNMSILAQTVFPGLEEQTFILKKGHA